MNILKNPKRLYFALTIIAIIVMWTLLLGLNNLFLDQEVINFNVNFLSKMAELRTPQLGEAFLFVTLLGKGYVVTLGTIFLATILAMYRKWTVLWTVLVSIATGQLLVTIAKNIFEKVRPPFSDALIIERTFSFPSGHTFAAVVFYGILTYLLLKIAKNKWQKILIVLGGMLIIFMVAFSRVFIGAHWPTDVLASFAAGSTWLAISIASLEIGEKLAVKEKKEALLQNKNIQRVGLALFIIWLIVLVYLDFNKLY